MKGLNKPLAISVLVLGLLGLNAIYANQQNTFHPAYTIKNLSQLPHPVNDSNLIIELNDKLLLSQADEALNTFQQEGVVFHHIAVAAEDGLTVNLNDPFFVSLSGVVDNKTTLEIASNVGISTDPDTLLTLSKLSLFSLQVDPQAYQSAFSAAPESSAQKVNIKFGTLDQVDAFNRTIFYGNVILKQQAIQLTGTSPALIRFLANLNKPANKKVKFGELDLNFTGGKITNELAKYIGGSTVHEAQLVKYQLGSSLSLQQASLYQMSFNEGMNEAIQAGGEVAPRMAIFGQPVINWGPTVKAYVVASSDDPVVFITNGQIKNLQLSDGTMQHMTLVTKKVNNELFKAAEAGQIAGAFVLLDTPSQAKRLITNFNNDELITGETPIGYIAGVSQDKTILEII